MATEDNASSLYGVLYQAMNDPELIGNLLRHPEFRRRAGLICQRIAGQAESEDLLQEVCQRVVERAGQLKPDKMRNEREFFSWFSLLARRVHLGRVLVARAASSCTAKAEGWPDSPAEVPPDDMGRFLAHADGCLYHARLLQAWDEKLRAVFRRARGADSRGRILRGAEMRASIAEHERRWQNWREVALKQGGRFVHVALYNGGTEVATSGRFYDFFNHVSRNELDPKAGLQIRGVVSSNPSESVLLGFYALAGVRHDGAEKTLELDNGYTVCLKVKQEGETTFEIHFRCVETVAPKRAPAPAEEAADEGVIDLTGDERMDGAPGLLTPLLLPPPLDSPVPPKSARWWPLSPGWQAAATLALLLVVAVPCCLFAGMKWGQETAEGNSLLSQIQLPQAPPPLPAQTPADVNENLIPRAVNNVQRHGSKERAARRKEEPMIARVTFTKVHRSTVGNHVALGVGGNIDSNNDLFDAAAARYQDSPAVSLASRWLAYQDLKESVIPDAQKALATLQSVSSELSAGTRMAGKAPGPLPGQTMLYGDSLAGEIDNQRSTPPPLLSSYDDQAYAVTQSKRTRTGASLRKASYEDWGGSPDTSVLHLPTNDALKQRIEVALRLLKFQFKSVAGEKLPAARFTVIWAGHTESASWVEGSFVVNVYAYIYREGEKNPAQPLSYEGVGDSLDAAYDKAVKKAVREVMSWIERDSEQRLSAPSDSPAAAQQPGAAPPKKDLAGGLTGVDAIPYRCMKQEPGTPAREKNVAAGPKQEEETEEKSLEE